MNDIRRKAEEIMKRGDELIAKRKRRRTMILRSCAVGAGAAAVLGIGLTTFALRPPKKPVPSRSGIISETETTSAEATDLPSAVTTAAGTASAAHTTATTATAATSSARSTATTSRTTASGARTTTSAAHTTRTVVSTTAAVQTSPPMVTSIAPTTKDIEQRIADIVMQMPEMMPVVQALPAVNENGERIPTFPMLINDRLYLLILKYDNGELDCTFDFNDDGKVNLYDAFELEAYLFCCDQYNRRKEYPYNFDEMFPDMEVFERADDFYGIHQNMYLLTYYMLYHNVDIPDAESIEETAREYAGSRPFPDFVFTNLSKDVSEIKESFYEGYEREYEALNRKEDEYPKYQLKMFKKIDSGELFPDADQDGSVEYMDIYYILKYYEEKATGFSRGIFSDSEVEWIEGHCDMDGDGWVDAKEAAWLMGYLFYYKNYDYVSHIEMEMEYRASRKEKDPKVTIIPEI